MPAVFRNSRRFMSVSPVVRRCGDAEGRWHRTS
jgi:hypothetical protein